MSSGRAFSLVELLVVMAIFLIVGSLLFYLLIKGLRWIASTGGEIKQDIELTVNTDLLIFELKHIGYGIAGDEEKLILEFYNGSDYPSTALADIATADDIADDLPNSVSPKKTLVLRETTNVIKTSVPTTGFVFWNGTDIIHSEPSGEDWSTYDCSWLLLDRTYNKTDVCTAGPDTFALGYPIDTVSACKDSADVYCCSNCPCTTIAYHLTYSDVPETCLPQTYVFRRVVKKSSTYTPIVNCVSDWTVWFGIDTDGDGDIDLWENQLPNNDIQTNTDMKKLKLVKIYLFTQVSYAPDPQYDYCTLTGADCDNECGNGYVKVDSLGGTPVCLKHPDDDTGWRHHRWKVLEVSVGNFPNIP